MNARTIADTLAAAAADTGNDAATIAGLADTLLANAPGALAHFRALAGDAPKAPKAPKTARENKEPARTGTKSADSGKARDTGKDAEIIAEATRKGWTMPDHCTALRGNGKARCGQTELDGDGRCEHHPVAGGAVDAPDGWISPKHVAAARKHIREYDPVASRGKPKTPKADRSNRIPPVAETCKGVVADGKTRCRSAIVMANGYCRSHQSQAGKSRPKARTVTPKAPKAPMSPLARKIAARRK